MALRITGSIAATAPASPRELAVRAERALLAGDLDAYAALWSRAADVPGDHGAYEARVLLAEHALRAGAVLPVPRVPPTYLAAADGLVGALHEAPAEPRLLNLAGVLLYELWALDAAEALFRAVVRLDPEHAQAAGNLAEVKRRRRGPAVRLAPAVALPLKDLAAHAVRTAARAVPAEGQTLTLAMIVRDEQEMLPRCLAAARPWVDQLVVVDTGSVDRTVEIAESFGAEVLHHAWTGDFAAARNVSFEAATGDWVLYLDADEVLVDGDGPALRALLGHTWREAFQLVETNFTGEEGDGTALVHSALRLFRNRPQYRFDGRLHEQIGDKLPTHLPERLQQSAVRLEHFGYLAHVRDAKDKSNRNLELLRRELAETAEPTAFLHFNLGSEHAALGDDAAAAAAFDAAWSMLQADPRIAGYGFAPALASRSVRALRETGRLEEADARAEDGLRRFPGFTDLVFAQGQIDQQRGDHAAAIAHFEHCLQLGEAPAAYTSSAGAGTFLARQAAAASHRHLGDLASARALLEAALTEQPQYLGTVDPLAQVLLALDVPPAEVVSRVEAALGEPTAGARYLLGTALFEAGAVEEAAVQFRAVLAARPANGAARVALGESLLSLACFDEAAEVAEAIEPADPCVPAAQRTAAFARLAAGRPAGATDRLPSAERQAYAAWSAALDGTAPEAPLAPATAGPVAVMLEALLRVEAYDAFEVLAGVLDRVAVAPRERHELLAQLYLRRGYLQSAADEWIAACQPAGPDVAALVGLAQVAVAQGNRDDARTFAEGAHELAPADPGVSALHAALAA